MVLKHIAVTGARGFIGRSVVEVLSLAPDVHVTVLIRSTDRRPFPQRWAEACREGRMAVLPVDLAQPPADLYARCGNPDVLLHLAWGGLPNYSADHHVARELPLHREFIRAAVHSGFSRVVIAGTCLEYGLAEGELHENAPIAPTNSYAFAKAQLHEELYEDVTRIGSRLTWLRLFYVHGPSQSLTTLRGQFEAARRRGDREFPMSPGDQMRDYLPVAEMGRLVSEVTLRQPGQDGTINVCSGRPVRIADLVNEWLAESRSTMRIRLGVYGYPVGEPLRAWGARGRLDAMLSAGEEARP